LNTYFKDQEHVDRNINWYYKLPACITFSLLIDITSSNIMMMRAFLTALLLIGVSCAYAQVLRDATVSPETDYSARFMCTMTADTTGTAPAICFGTPTGSAFFTITNATQPTQLLLDGIGTPFLGTGISNAILAGNHFAIIIDGMGCRDTVTFNITQPTAIGLTATSTPAICFGAPSGTGTATANGGVTPYIYQWEPCAGGPVKIGKTVTGLLAGCYNVTVADAEGCLTTAQTTVGQPTQITYTSTVDSVSCFQSLDGRATITSQGGTGAHTYVWDNTQTTTTATSLDARYHYVTITDAAGCKVVAEVNVPGPERISLDSISRVNPTCFGGANGTAKAYTKGGTGPYIYLWSAGVANSDQVSNLSSGTYRCTVIDSHGCRDSLTFLMSSPPPMSVATQNVVHETCIGQCNGGARVFAAGGSGGFTYNWSQAGIPNTVFQPTTLCAGAYTVTISDSKSCTQTVQFTINPGADVTTQFTGTTPTCSNSNNGSIQATVFGGQSPISYKWSTGQTTTSINSLPCGSYTLISTDARNCKDTAVYQFTCPPPVALDALNQTPANCFGQTNGSLAVTASGGTAPLSFKWNDTNGQTNATAINLGAGTYIVTITDAKGCTLTATGAVTAPTALTGATTTQSILCFGTSTGSANAQAGGGTSGYTYLWSNGATTAQLAQVAAGPYTVTITDANGCSLVPAVANVTQSPLMGVNATVTVPPCTGGSDGVANVTAQGGAGNYTYLWSTGGTTQTVSQLGTATYTVTVTDANNCTNSAELTIVSQPAISANIATTNVTCFGTLDGQAAITSIAGGAGNGNLSLYTYAWSVPTPPNATALTDVGAGTYTVTISDAVGCNNTVSVVVTSPAEVVPHITLGLLKCFGDSDATITLDSVSGDFPVQSIAWSNASSSPSAITNLSAGTYSILVTDLNGCTGQAFGAVLEPQLLQVDSFAGVPPICHDAANGQLTVFAKGGTNPLTYAWGNQTSTTNQLVSVPTGRYVVTITDANGCLTLDSSYLEQPDPMRYEIEQRDITCFGQNDGYVHLDVSGGQKPYKYILNNDTSKLGGYFYGLQAGLFDIKIVDALGCALLDTFSLTQPVEITVDLGADRVISYGDVAQLQPIVTNAVGQIILTWNATTSTDTITCNDPNCASILARPLFDATYEVRIEDENGCQSFADVLIKVEKMRGVFVPNAFTPNGDGENELAVVFAKTQMIEKINVLRIFDRFGSLVYHQADFKPNDETIGWDGNFKGKPSDPGVFTYYLEAQYRDGFREQHHGNITLIR
jgi:large repetitive protein